MVDRSLSLLGNPGMYRLRPFPWLQTSFYDTAPLRATLAELVDPARLNRAVPRVVVGATNVGTGEMEFFDRDRPGGLTFEHVVASGSLPPSFPATEIDGQSYWDGGLFSNTPLSPAINALERAAGGDRAVERELIVVELFPMRAEVPRTLPDVAGPRVPAAVLEPAHPGRRDLRPGQRRGGPGGAGGRGAARRTATSATTRPGGGCGPTAGSTTSTS